MKLETLIEPTGVTIVKFSAGWCGPCKTLDKVVLSQYNDPNIHIKHVDIEEYNDLAEECDIKSVPTMFIYKDGVLIDTVVGAITKTNLDNIINK